MANSYRFRFLSTVFLTISLSVVLALVYILHRRRRSQGVESKVYAPEWVGIGTRSRRLQYENTAGIRSNAHNDIYFSHETVNHKRKPLQRTTSMGIIMRWQLYGRPRPAADGRGGAEPWPEHLVQRAIEIRGAMRVSHENERQHRLKRKHKRSKKCNGFDDKIVSCMVKCRRDGKGPTCIKSCQEWAKKDFRLELALQTLKLKQQAHVNLRAKELVSRAEMVYERRTRQWTKSSREGSTCHSLHTRCDLDLICNMSGSQLVGKCCTFQRERNNALVRNSPKARACAGTVNIVRSDIAGRGNILGYEYNQRADAVLKQIQLWAMDLQEGEPCEESSGRRCSLGLACKGTALRKHCTRF